MINMNYNNDSCMIHKVKSGDTMYILSRMYNVRIDDLLSANPMVNIYNMQIGDEVCIPVRPKPIPISIPRDMNIPMDNDIGDDFYEMVKRFDK